MRGLVTAAYGHPVYLDQAVSLRLSFLESGCPLPFSLVCGNELKNGLTPEILALFDQCIVVEDSRLSQFQGKLISALKSPYQETIYFDSDCWMSGAWEPWISFWFEQSFTVAGHLQTEGDFAGIQVSDWLKIHHITAMPLFNAGIFAFNEDGRQILIDALHFMEEPEKNKIPKNDGGYNEQVALGIAMAKSGILPLQSEKDIHFSFHGAGVPLRIFDGQIRFEKNGIWRSPPLFHYTPLFRGEYTFSVSRKTLDIIINPIRAKYGFKPQKHFSPLIRDIFALLLRGRFPHDLR